MKRFAFRVAGFCLLQMAVGLCFWGSKLPGENNYLARTIEKHDRLRTVKNPRVILVGGSNVAFGFISGVLRGQLNLPVVNMGLVAGLGFEFMLNEVRAQIRKGDVVVLSPEYDFGGGGRDIQVIRQILELRPASARFASGRDWMEELADSGLNWMGGYFRRAILKSGAKGRVEPGTPDTYRRDGFDPANGYVAHHGLPSLMVAKVGPGGLVRTTVHPLEPRVLRRVKDFAEHCASVGAICVFSCPPQPPGLLQTNLDEVKQIIRQLESVEHLTVIDSPEEQIYPLEMFYDTQYHLTKEGALRRSRLVGERIQALRQNIRKN